MCVYIINCGTQTTYYVEVIENYKLLYIFHKYTICS